MNKNAKLLFVDGTPRECDMCDKNGICASIDTLSGHVLIICGDCLKNIIRIIEEE